MKWYEDENIIGKMVYDFNTHDILEVEGIVNGKVECIGCHVLIRPQELRPATKDEVLSMMYVANKEED